MAAIRDEKTFRATLYCCSTIKFIIQLVNYISEWKLKFISSSAAAFHAEGMAWHPTRDTTGYTQKHSHNQRVCKVNAKG